MPEEFGFRASPLCRVQQVIPQLELLQVSEAGVDLLPEAVSPARLVFAEVPDAVGDVPR